MNINDIALLKIRGKLPLDQNKVSQVELPLDSVVVRWPTLYTSCILVGWGCTNANGPVSNTARVLEMRVLQSQACTEMYDRSFVLDSRFQLCAGYYMSGKSACQADDRSTWARNQLACSTPAILSIVYSIAHESYHINAWYTASCSKHAALEFSYLHQTTSKYVIHQGSSEIGRLVDEKLFGGVTGNRDEPSDSKLGNVIPPVCPSTFTENWFEEPKSNRWAKSNTLPVSL
ncbi:hypothetical protein EG68_07926 [Paragonimus skrjabini miyazakii]|uniref:Peptidase S1 domain-containing protein n=1 Tax=Paragonimus skrjabini miyazakii TaxID=59628 RepID=A0A8S9YL77_9TREM|nr:hypothetical protein EG68_07926 [Paragonimus skrjabini miyazakii]